MSSDELFWRKNERFFTQRMGQPCCTLAGISKLLSHLPGNFAVVVHGEMDCLNNFPHFEGCSLDRFYCTHVSQLQFSRGDTASPLRECLEAVLETQRPQAVFVLSMCLMEMIHDDFPKVVADISARTGVPIVPLRTSGLQVVAEAEYTDDLYCQLSRIFPRASSADPALVNLVGLPALSAHATAELSAALSAAGRRLNCTYPAAASLDDWQRLDLADVNLLVDASMYPKLTELLRASRRTCHDVPLPIGCEQTSAFYRATGAALGERAAVERAAHAWAEKAATGVADFKRRHAGLRLAAGLRMANFSSPAQLARDGLAEISAFTELGLQVTLLIQGPPEVKGRSYFQARLSELGCELPSIVFAEPGELAEHLGSGRFDLAYLRDHARQYTERAGLPLISAGRLQPLFGGVLENLKTLTRAVESRRSPSASVPA